MHAVKLTNLTDDYATVAGYGVVFGGQDLTGDTFTADTDFDVKRAVGRPVFYDHSLQQDVEHEIGEIAAIKTDATGLWVEAQLDRSKAYVEQVLKLVEQGALGYSSGSASHLLRRAGGMLKRWPIIEVSLTPTPAEPRTLGVQRVKAIATETAETQQQPQAEPQVAGDATADAMAGSESPAPQQSTVAQETSTMNEEQIKQLVADMLKEHQASAAPSTDADAVKTAVTDAMKAFMEHAPAIKAAGVVTPSVQVVEDEKDKAIKAFQHYIRTGDASALRAAKATLNTGTDSQGGYLVPDQYSNELVVGLKEASILRSAGARILSISGTDAYRVPRMNHSGRAVKTGQGQKFNQQEPTLDELTFRPLKYTRLAKATDEQLEDSRIDVVSAVLMPDFTQAFAAGENEDFTIGDGVDDPQGVAVGASLGRTASSASAITLADLIRLKYSLNRLYRQRAVWMLNDETVAAVELLTDSNGRPIWQDNQVDGQPPRLLGHAVITNNSMPLIGASNRSVLFGDFSYYWIGDFKQLEIKRLNELYAEDGQVGFRAYKRYDAHVMLAEAIKALQHPESL